MLSCHLKVLKRKQPKNLFFGHLNDNSIRNKFVTIQELIKRTFDIFLISETRLMIHFQMGNLKLKVIKVLRKIRMPLEEDLFSLEICLPNVFIEILPLKLRLLNSKW